MKTLLNLLTAASISLTSAFADTQVKVAVEAKTKNFLIKLQPNLRAPRI